MEGKTVLLVEDDDDLRRVFSYSLKYAGFTVREAADGTEALRDIESAPPDLVVLDLGLRTLDGMSVRQELAANPQTQAIPVLIVTAAAISQRHLLPGDCLLRKPVPPESLVAAVRDCLKV